MLARRSGLELELLDDDPDDVVRLVDARGRELTEVEAAAVIARTMEAALARFAANLTVEVAEYATRLLLRARGRVD